MRNIPKELKGVTIKKAVEQLLRDTSIQRVKHVNDYAFLTFRDHESAKAALNSIRSKFTNMLY